MMYIVHHVCQYLLCLLLTFLFSPPKVDSGLVVATLYTQEDADILCQQKKKTLDLQSTSTQAT